MVLDCFFFQAEDGIRDLVRSRGLGDVYKRQQQVDKLRDAPFLVFRQMVVDVPAEIILPKLQGVFLSLIHI